MEVIGTPKLTDLEGCLNIFGNIVYIFDIHYVCRFSIIGTSIILILTIIEC